MRLKFKIQHYLTITDRELNFLLVLAGILLLGMVLKFIQQNQVPDYSMQYALLDSLTALGAKHVVDSDSAMIEMSSSSTISSAVGAVVPPAININAAGSDDLTRLPGIGPAMAKRIIDYRDRYGNYKEKEDLMNVKGIGPKKFEKIRKRITL